jgi:hypothetical protein
MGSRRKADRLHCNLKSSSAMLEESRHGKGWRFARGRVWLVTTQVGL